MSNDVDTVQTTQQASPFLPNMPQLQRAFGSADQVYGSSGTPSAYGLLYDDIWSRRHSDKYYQPGQVADSLHGMALNPNLYKPSEAMNRFTSGAMLSPESNPWLKGAYEDAAGALRGQINSQFAGGGRYGSGANQEVLGRNLGTLANQMYGGAYQQGVQQMLSASMLGDQLTAQNPQRQMQAAALFPTLSAAQDRDLLTLAGAQEAQQQAPWSNLQRYMGIVNPGTNFGSTSTGSQPYFSNPFGQGVGAAGTLGFAANQLFGQSGLFPSALRSAGSGISDVFSGLFGGGGFDPSAMDFSAAIDPFSSYGYF